MLNSRTVFKFCLRLAFGYFPLAAQADSHARIVRDIPSGQQEIELACFDKPNHCQVMRTLRDEVTASKKIPQAQADGIFQDLLKNIKGIPHATASSTSAASERSLRLDVSYGTIQRQEKLSLAKRNSSKMAMALMKFEAQLAEILQ